MQMNRREFGGVVAAALATGGPRFKKGITGTIFPPGMPLAEQFRAAKNAGFEGVEIPVGRGIKLDTPPGEVRRVAEAARSAGVTVVSVWVSLWDEPLNSAEPAVRERGLETIRRALDVAAGLGCGAMLLVPAHLGEGAKFEVGYQDTWERVSAELKKVLPVAAEKRVVLTPENVWNKFLVSPLEMRAFVDQFHSPWLQTHFDIGNVMQYGYPQDWILTLGRRIQRVHAKDYKLSERAEAGHFTDLLKGDVNWREVMAALVKVGYQGFISPEIEYEAGDPQQLRHVSEALDRILAMA